MPGLLPLDIAKLIYGGFNPNGQTPDKFVALGRTLAHGIRGNPGIQPVYGNSSTGYPPIDNSDDNGLPPAATDVGPQDFSTEVQTNGNRPGATAANTYYNIARPSGPLSPRDALSPSDPDYGNPDYIGLGSPSYQPQPLQPQTPVYGMGPNYVDPREANSFISGLQGWNGPGQANPTGGEGAFDNTIKANAGIGGSAARFGMMGMAKSGRLRGKQA